jgi:hypothetical protein
MSALIVHESHTVLFVEAGSSDSGYLYALQESNTPDDDHKELIERRPLETRHVAATSNSIGLFESPAWPSPTFPGATWAY